MNLTIADILEVFPGSKVVESMPFDPVKHAGQFLSLLYGKWERNFLGQFFEVRLIFADRAEQRFYNSPDEFLTYDLQALLKPQESGNYGIYFGVCPRIRKSGKNEDVKSIPALWADMDGENAQKILTFKPSPDIIVFSGNGYHAYWLLTKPVPANEITQKMLRSIQKACGSDSVSDFARIMRLPGSLNLKDPTKPKCCRVVMMGVKNAV